MHVTNSDAVILSIDSFILVSITTVKDESVFPQRQHDQSRAITLCRLPPESPWQTWCSISTWPWHTPAVFMQSCKGMCPTTRARFDRGSPLGNPVLSNSRLLSLNLLVVHVDCPSDLRGKHNMRLDEDGYVSSDRRLVPADAQTMPRTMNPAIQLIMSNGPAAKSQPSVV